jgi:hypothetical protein
MSRTDAVNYCKRTDGAMVVIEDDVTCGDVRRTCSALQHEGVRISVRGLVGDFDRLARRVQVGDFNRPIVARKAPGTEPASEKPVLRCNATCN